jgi:hypothetical protein
MMAELDAFFENVAFAGGSFNDIFLSNAAFVSQETAPLYGLDAAAYGPTLTQVALDANERPGFLTRAGFLSSFSAYNSTSPILRGVFVSTRLLAVELGVPPDGALNTPVPPGDYTTNRQVVDALTTPLPCGGCHISKINPAGYILERFDSVGSVQTVDPLGGPIDGTADVFFNDNNIKTITSPLELMTEIAASPEARRVYAERWVSFATGRLPNANDACVVDGLQTMLSQDGYAIINLFSEITQADSFRLRTVGN